MPQTISDLLITPSTWVDVFTVTGISPTVPILIQNKSGLAHIEYVISDTIPTAGYTSGGMIPRYPEYESSKFLYTSGLKLWVKTNQLNVIINVSNATKLLGEINGIPEGTTEGFRAFNVQSYNESNKKLGSQWGASRRLAGAQAATNGGKYYSILKTRTLPIDLKSRVFSYTGNGLIARFYTGFTPVTLPAEEPVYSLRPAFPAFKDFSLYAIPTAPASLGTKWSYDLFLEGNQQTQGKGAAVVPAGDGWIIDPNKEILLEIESLDSQNVSATLSMFNGLLDLPRP